MAFGDSYTRGGMKLNYTYTQTGPGMYEMDRVDRVKGKLPGPSAENPIGNPKLPGKTSSGGMNWAMYMAMEFNSTLTLLYNFARSGSTVDAEIIPPRIEKRFSFANQVVHFNDTIGHKPDYAAWTAKNTVATIWFGINDVTLSYKMRGIEKKYNNAVWRIFDLADMLYEMGIRQFVFIEVPPFDLTPTRQNHKIKYNETNNYHELLQYGFHVWNQNLRKGTTTFERRHPDASVGYVEVWDIFYQAFLDPESLGAPNATCTDPKGEKCLWANTSHPGTRIHHHIGRRVAKAVSWNTVSPFY
ncbi:hypothetical protein NW768_006742 [Fusarium equiseti]|uniref:Uncharacterized protein n=1 Tax=Fusarium equiseti TaxID=61235 RepID=A0ABQ8R9N5_FUSEQ|nr:hypothetical protein NW768_006742 [Fusarium equiseti]